LRAKKTGQAGKEAGKGVGKFGLENKIPSHMTKPRKGDGVVLNQHP